MTGQVDFYVLPGTSSQQRCTFACRVVEKAWLRGLNVALLSDDAAELRLLDELLWTFNDQSFVPHGILSGIAPAVPGAASMPAPVRLTATVPDDPAVDILVNLGAAPPSQLARFARIAEIVDADPERRQRGRERFKGYRDLQLTLQTHHIDGAIDP